MHFILLQSSSLSSLPFEIDDEQGDYNATKSKGAVSAQKISEFLETNYTDSTMI